MNDDELPRHAERMRQLRRIDDLIATAELTIHQGEQAKREILPLKRQRARLVRLIKEREQPS